MWSVLFLGLILLVLIGLWASKFSTEAFPRIESPREELKKRYERGDIDKEEYERKLSKMPPE